ncbi:MAG: hypothetical protein H6681_03885 [Desulfobacteraceae bacterium]|nr:hypothetical protein [Desulfobacteraceae bacterium]
MQVTPEIQMIEKSFSKFMDNIFEEEKILLIENYILKLSFQDSVSDKVKDAKPFAIELLSAKENNDLEKREIFLTKLYLLFHKFGAGYSHEEEKFIQRSKGLKWLPGGLMPVVLGSYLMKSEYEFCDLGCGNGFQGILMQVLCPHKKTRQIEIAGSYLNKGEIFLSLPEIDREKICFENIDISDFQMQSADFIYMYRPARPMGEGSLIYQKLSDKFLNAEKSFYLLSVADCFEPFIKGSYERVYQNEFLNIFYFKK